MIESPSAKVTRTGYVPLVKGVPTVRFCDFVTARQFPVTVARFVISGVGTVQLEFSEIVVSGHSITDI